MLLAQTIILRTNVENLRLREQPNLESKIIKTVPIGTSLYWLNERSERKMTADWKGQKVADYWYKVSTERENKDSIAWVFRKGIDLKFIEYGIDIYNKRDSFNYTLNNDWLKIEKSNSKIFNSLEVFTTKWKTYKIKEGEYEKPFTLTYENGKTQKLNERPEDEPHWLYGDFLELGYYYLGGGVCCEIYKMVKKADGTFYDFEAPFTYKNNPIISPSKSIIACHSGCEPGATDGIALY